jgi:hypothetical protein
MLTWPSYFVGVRGEVHGQVDLHSSRARRLGRAAAPSGHVVSFERTTGPEERRGGGPNVAMHGTQGRGRERVGESGAPRRGGAAVEGEGGPVGGGGAAAEGKPLGGGRRARQVSASDYRGFPPRRLPYEGLGGRAV